MKLKFNSKYKSIERFSDFELCSFSVLTGLNGAGKTQFLEAIRDGNITIEGVNKEYITYFNYNTFLLDNESQFNGTQILSEKHNTWEYFLKNIKPTILSYKNNLGDNYSKIIDVCILKDKDILKLNKKDFDDLTLYEIFKVYKENIYNYFHSKNLQNNNQAISIYSLFKRLDYSLDEIDEEEFIKRIRIFQLKNNVLPTQLGKIISDYFFSYENNNYKKYKADSQGKELTYLTEEEFINLNGEKPWEVINKILESFNSIKYQIKSPEELSLNDNYQLKLLKDGIDNNINFNDLSSGEKTLMALVASLYKTSSDNYYPKVLLLDEIDSSLHPSMIKNLLNVIEKVFIKNGVEVILVTHSPSTIALANDSSIKLLNINADNIIEDIKKEDAVSILTEGFLIVKENQKNVLVEGTTDDKIFYNKVFNNLINNNYITNDNVGINFIPSSKGDSSGDGSCEKIKKIVKQIEDLELDDLLLGIIDMDNGATVESDKIFILKRYSFENYVYDPVFIFALLLNSGYSDSQFILLLEDIELNKFEYLDLGKLSEENINKIINCICNTIKEFNNLENLDEELINIEYVNGKKVKIPNWYLIKKGHDLEGIIPNTFKKDGNVLVTKKTINDYIDRLPGFISKDLKDIMESIQNT